MPIAPGFLETARRRKPDGTQVLSDNDIADQVAKKDPTFSKMWAEDKAYGLEATRLLNYYTYEDPDFNKVWNQQTKQYEDPGTPDEYVFGEKDAVGFFSPIPTRTPGTITPVEAVAGDGLLSSAAGAASNVLPSAIEVGRQFGSVVAHPLQSVEAIARGVVGAGEKGYEKLTGKKAPQFEADGKTINYGPSENQAVAEAVGKHIAERYGSKEALVKTIYEDPVGFMTDLSAVVTVGGGVIKGGGKLLGAAGVADNVAAPVISAGESVIQAGQAIDPLVAPLVGAKKLGGKMLSGIGGGVSDELAGAMERTKIDLPATGQVDSSATKYIEAAAESSIFGGRLTKKVKEAEAALQEIATDLTRGGEASTPTTLGQKIYEQFKGFKKVQFESQDAFYSRVKDLVRGNPGQEMVQFSKTQALLEDLIKEAKLVDDVDPSTVAELTKLRESLFSDLQGPAKMTIDKDGIFTMGPPPKERIPKITIEKANKLRKTLAEGIAFDKPVAKGLEGQIMKIGKTLKDELDVHISKNVPELKTALEEANALYQNGQELLDTEFGRIIAANENTPSVIVEDVLKGMPLEDVQRLKTVIGEESVRNLQRAFMENMITAATNPKTGRMTGLSSKMKTFKDNKLQAFLDPEQYKALKDLETMVNATEKASSVMRSSPTAHIARYTRLAGELGAAFFINPLLPLSAIMGEAGFATFLQSKAGQQFLINGIDSAAIGAGPILKGIGNVNKLQRALQLFPDPEEEE